MRIYYRQNSRVIEIARLTDHEGTPVIGADVKAKFSLEGGGNVPDVPEPIALVGEGDGKYLAKVPPINLPDGTSIVLEVTAEYSDVLSTVREVMVVRDRGFADSCGSF